MNRVNEILTEKCMFHCSQKLFYISEVTEWSPHSGEGHITGGFRYRNGVLTVPETGIYYVYCQIYFNHIAVFHVMLNGSRLLFLGHKESNTSGVKYSGGNFKFNKGDKLHVYMYRWNNPVKTYMGHGHSFFGAYKL